MNFMYPDDSLTLHTDLYQINMMQVYFRKNIYNKQNKFSLTFRAFNFSNLYILFFKYFFMNTNVNTQKL